jgi:predicted DNA-binding helix-hairpin-helix protein
MEKTQTQKLAHAHRIMERYFDTDIQDADSAMDVFLDNGVDPEIAAGIAHDMFPVEDCND